MNTKYVIITPVRNEEKYIETTIKSIISQTIKPLEWIIVNDGSTDNTGKIIDSFARQFGWISTLHRIDRGFRKSGDGVIESFYEGFNSLKADQYEFVIKLDGDLSFDPDYFERCFEYFNIIPKLGIAGGSIYNVVEGKIKIEKNPIFHVRGATKIYRKECWNSIGGLLRAPGWDTLDEVKANMLGWTTQSFPELKVIHHRFTGKAEGPWHSSIKDGMANYIAGYHPLFMFFKCLRRIFNPPFFINGLGHFYGFMYGYLKGISRVDDKPLIEYLRKQQLRRLVGKDSIWK